MTEKTEENLEVVPRHALEIAENLTKFGTAVSTDVKMLGATLREESDKIRASCETVSQRVSVKLEEICLKIHDLAGSIESDCEQVSLEIDDMTAGLIAQIREFAVKARSVGVTHKNARLRLNGEKPMSDEHVLVEPRAVHQKSDQVASAVAEALEGGKDGQ